MQASPAQYPAAITEECSVTITISASKGDFVLRQKEDRSMLIAAGARVGEGATKVVIEVSAVITAAARVSEFVESVAVVAAQGAALATTRPCSGSLVWREWLTRQRQL